MINADYIKKKQKEAEAFRLYNVEKLLAGVENDLIRYSKAELESFPDDFTISVLRTRGFRIRLEGYNETPYIYMDD